MYPVNVQAHVLESGPSADRRLFEI
jgi:hypothetical protein